MAAPHPPVATSKPQPEVEAHPYLLRVYEVDPKDPQKRHALTKDLWENLLKTLFFHLCSINEFPVAPDTWAKNHGIFKPSTLAYFHRMRHIIADLGVEGHRFRAFSEKELEVPMAEIQVCSYGKAEFYSNIIGMSAVIQQIKDNPNNGLSKLPANSYEVGECGILSVSEGGPKNACVNMKVNKQAWDTIQANGGVLQVGSDSWRVFSDNVFLPRFRQFPERRVAPPTSNSGGVSTPPPQGS